MKVKVILLCLSLVFSLTSTFAQDKKDQKQIKWMSFDEVFKEMEKNPKKILIDVYTDWCGPCKMMNANTFTHPEVVDYINKNYYAVKFNAESNDVVTFKGTKFQNPQYDPSRAGGRNGTHELTQAIAAVNGRIAYPTIVYMDENLNIISPVQGYWQPAQIEPLLNFFGENHYQTVQWEEFQKTFKGKIAAN